MIMQKTGRSVIALLLCFVLCLGLLPFSARATDLTSASGSTYTRDPVLAAKLDNIFNGSVALFSNTSATFPLGSSLDNNRDYYVAGTISGRQCYIYAQAVYYYLFGDIPFHGYGYSYWSRSNTVITNAASASYDSFQAAGVGFGSYIRTTPKSDGSYYGNDGHSMIILSYDRDYITVLHGNANGQGKVLVSQHTWSEFNSKYLTRLPVRGSACGSEDLRSCKGRGA